MYLLLCCIISFVLQSPKMSLRSGLYCATHFAKYTLIASGNPAHGACCGILASAGWHVTAGRQWSWCIWIALSKWNKEGRQKCSPYYGKGKLRQKQKRSAPNHPRSLWKRQCSSTVLSQRLDPASLISTKWASKDGSFIFGIQMKNICKTVIFWKNNLASSPQKSFWINCSLLYCGSCFPTGLLSLCNQSCYGQFYLKTLRTFPWT